MKRISILALTLILTACQFARQNNDAPMSIDPFKLYNKNFNKARIQNNTYQEWAIFNRQLGVHKYGIYNKSLNDSSYYIRSGSKNLAVAMHFQAFYEMPLPKNAKRMNLILEYEYRPFDDSIFSMTLNFNDRTSTLSSITIPLKPKFYHGISIIPLSIEKICAKIPSGANNFGIKLEANKGEIILGQCTIEIDSKSIEDYTYDQSVPLSVEELHQIERELSYSFVANDKAKIIGVGESLHGSCELIEQAVKIVKEKITLSNFEILFIEASPIIGYCLNQYVHSERSDLKCLTEMEKNTYNNSHFIDLINFIRIRNRGCKRNVIIVGYETINNSNIDSLFNSVASFFPTSVEFERCVKFIAELKQKLPSEKLIFINGDDVKRLSALLYKAIVSSKFKNNYYESYIYNYLLSVVNSSGSPNEIYKFHNNRDSIMANYISLFIEHLPSNVSTIIHGHLGHIAKHKKKRENKGTFTNSLGYYLSKKFGDMYFAIGLYTGSGTCWAGWYEAYDLNRKKGIYPVFYPLGSSVEQLCISMNRDSFYINTINNILILDRIIYERAMGAFWQPMQFEPVDLRQEIDAIWFTKYTTSI